HAARIALILHGMHNLDKLPPVLSPARMSDAWRVVDFLKAHLLHAPCFLDPEMERKVLRRVAALKKEGATPCTPSDVARGISATNREGGVAVAKMHLNALVGKGQLLDKGRERYDLPGAS